ncbi:MAG: ferritin-like domain-containing protein, partial [Elusimicrobia bacterium]|nr:ferritin-like domain-containing protein [Elusimicrobiota bacterium]
PKCDWKGALEIFKSAYQHELFISSKINELVKLAQDEKDYPALEFLQWFVKEQVEEEDNTSKAAQKLEMIGSSGAGLVMMDKEFGKRKKD